MRAVMMKNKRILKILLYKSVFPFCFFKKINKKMSVGTVASNVILQTSKTDENDIDMLFDYYIEYINRNLEFDSPEEKELSANRHRLLASRVLRHYLKNQNTAGGMSDQMLARSYLESQGKGKEKQVQKPIPIIRPTVELMQQTTHNVLGKLFPRNVVVSDDLGRFEVAIDDMSLFGRVQDTIINHDRVVVELQTLTGARIYARIVGFRAEFTVSRHIFDLISNDKIMQARLLYGMQQVEHIDFTYFGPKLEIKEAIYDHIRDYMVGMPIVHIGQAIKLPMSNALVVVRNMVPEKQGFMFTPFDAEISFSMQEETISHRIASKAVCFTCASPNVKVQCSQCVFAYCSSNCSQQHWSKNEHGFKCIEKRGIDQMEEDDSGDDADEMNQKRGKRNTLSNERNQDEATLTAMALVQNPRRLLSYVKQMPREYLLNLLNGIVRTPMTQLLENNNYFWFLVLHHLTEAYENVVDYKRLVRMAAGLA